MRRATPTPPTSPSTSPTWKKGPQMGRGPGGGRVEVCAAAGAAAAANDFETAPNAFVHNVTAVDAAGNSDTANITLNVTDLDELPPVVNDQAFGYAENQLAGATLATVAFSDNVAVTGFSFTATGTNTSADTFFQIDASGNIPLTAAGAAAAANDFETAPNAFVHNVTAVDAAGNSDTANITLNVTDLGDVPPVVTTSGGAL